MRVAILDDYQHAALASADWSPLAGRAELTVFDAPLGAAAAERLAEFDIVVTMRERQRFPRALIARLPRLKMIALTGMGAAAIDLAAARERGIVVCGTVGDRSMAAEVELVWALILAAARHVTEEDRAIRAGGWQTALGMRLSGKTLGIVGLGTIGTRVAAIGQAFGMHIQAWSPNLTAAHAAEAGVAYADKEALFTTSDVISVHLRLGDRSRGLVGAAELARMKPTAILVNTSRGPIVDEAALLDALDAGKIGAAALDVYDTEPLPADHPLRTAPRTVLTPHIGYVADDNYAVFYGQSVENIAAFLDGAPIRVIGGEARGG